MSRDDAVRELAAAILGRIAQPKDHWEVAAHLEIAGVRDVDARTEYGCRDVFDLARRIVALAGEIPTAEPEPVKRPAPVLVRFLRAYLTGVLFSMPMAVQIFAMTIFGYALWSWISFQPRDATAIALGTLTSFVVTGGFTQAISRRGLFYIHQQEDILAKKITYGIVVAGFVTVAVVAVVLFLVNLVFGLVPADMVWKSQLYYLLLSVLWLTFSILYMLRKQLLFTVITVVAILVVHLVVLFQEWSMITAHAAGLLAAIGLSAIAGWWILRRRAREAEREFVATELPRPSMLLYATMPYFWYGVVYFSFLFADRFVAWTADTGRGLLPYFVWFDSRYELGMDWALFCFVLTVGVLEFTMLDFSERIVPAEQHARADEMDRFNRAFTRFYYSHLLLFVIVAVLAIFGTYWGMHLLREAEVFPLLEAFFNPVTESVFWWAAVGYVFMIFGLFNSVFLFALSRPGFVLRSLVPALLVNLVVGFVMSRAVSYELAVVGMTVGAFAFMVLSFFYARRTFRRLDYYYYSAY